MTLTNNETAWAVMIFALVISMAWGALMTWISIKAQHAKNIQEIQADIKNIFARLFIWVSNLCAVAYLVFEFISPLPISRRDVFLIVWSVSILFISLILTLSIRLMDRMMDMLRLHSKHIDATEQISNSLDRTIGIIESMPNQEDSPDQKTVR
jgi:ABC-type multidrug transport system fused ATPase/permease subunit